MVIRVDVVIDDYLPVYEDRGKLCFCQNRVETNEMFGPLLEKAYAKLNLCYEFLQRGYPHDAFVNFTGGIDEMFEIAQIRQNSQLIDNLWEILFKTLSYESLIVCSKGKESSQGEIELPNGLVTNHAYSILNIFEIINKNGIFNDLRKIESEKPAENSLKLLRYIF